MELPEESIFAQASEKKTPESIIIGQVMRFMIPPAASSPSAAGPPSPGSAQLSGCLRY